MKRIFICKYTILDNLDENVSRENSNDIRGR